MQLVYFLAIGLPVGILSTLFLFHAIFSLGAAGITFAAIWMFIQKLCVAIGIGAGGYVFLAWIGNKQSHH